MFCNQCLTDHLTDENCDGRTCAEIEGEVRATCSPDVVEFIDPTAACAAKGKL
jgi:hypothetical protein